LIFLEKEIQKKPAGISSGRSKSYRVEKII